MRVLLTIMLLLLCSCSEKIVSNVNELRANKIIIALHKYGIKAEKVKDGATWGIEVSKNDSTRALQIMALSRFLTQEPGPETSSGFVQTKKELNHFLERKIARSIEQTLIRMPHVMEARVHINNYSKSEFNKKKEKQTASVLVVIDKEDSIEEDNIKNIVSGASGLSREDVLVVAVKEQEPDAIKIESVIDVNKFDFDRGHYLLLTIPCLLAGIVLVRRLDLSSKKNIDKLLKIGSEQSSQLSQVGIMQAGNINSINSNSVHASRELAKVELSKNE